MSICTNLHDWRTQDTGTGSWEECAQCGAVIDDYEENPEDYND